jgi:hypothetical protein
MRDTLRDAGRNFAGLLIGLSLATVASGAVAGDDEEAAAKAKAAAEAAAKELHSISVFNFVQDWRGRGGAVPVLVTMKVQGGEALDIFCNNVPRVQARILQAVLNGTQRGAARRHGIGSLKTPLHREIARLFPEKSVRSLDMRIGRTPSEFAKDIQGTTDACRALKS